MRAALLAAALLLAAPPATGESLVVGSKNFGESRLLGEIFAQLLEAETDLTAERRLGLAGTTICFQALRSGEIDLYPEYTGTGLVTILGMPAEGDPPEVLARVRTEFRHRYDLEWLAPLGFENAYEVAVRSDVAREHGLRTIADLVPLAPGLTAGFGYEFTEREDGLKGLARVYGLRFGDVLNMQQNVKYQAAGAGRLDVLDVYTTDGQILVHDLTVLEDDRGHFPPYQAAALVNGKTLRRHPEVAAALTRLSGLMDEETMRAWNRRVDVDGVPVEEVAREALAELGMADRGKGAATGVRAQGFWSYLWESRREILGHTGRHLWLVALSLAAAVLVAVPLGVWLERRRESAETVVRASGVIQTIPSIALLAFMIPLLGVGAAPAVAALFLYSLYPILRNTFTGVRDADPNAAAAALACGMNPRQVLWRVRLPLAAPVIMAGVRTAAVINVGTATLAAFIGAGGLGEPIVRGLQLAEIKVVLSGAVPAALLALLLDGLLALVEHVVRPRGY